MAGREGSRRSNAYELFILVLTVYSLVIMVALLLPWLSAATVQALELYDNLICVVFLADFGLRMARAPSKRGYFFAGRGWLDLLGSIPADAPVIADLQRQLEDVRLELVALREHLTGGRSADDEPDR